MRSLRAQSNAAPKDQALDFTGRVVVIGMHYDAELLMRCERAHYLHEDVRTCWRNRKCA